jgi:hypothetical protein
MNKLIHNVAGLTEPEAQDIIGGAFQMRVGKTAYRSSRRICFRLFWHLYVIFIVAFFGCSQLVAAQPDKVELSLFVSSCWGGDSIDSARISVLSGDDLRPDFFTYPTQNNVRLIPGSYVVDVEKKNFRSFAKPISLNARNLFLPVCLNVSPIEDSKNEQPPSLIGSVSKQYLSDAPNWVRLVGLYYDFNATELISPDGSFSFVGLRPARYLLMLFNKGELRTTRKVDVRAFDTKINIDGDEAPAEK